MREGRRGKARIRGACKTRTLRTPWSIFLWTRCAGVPRHSRRSSMGRPDLCTWGGKGRPPGGGEGLRKD